MEPLIITAAVTGSRTPREKCPHIPILPEEIADAAVEAVRAGAAVVHIHVRDPETGVGTQDEGLYRRVLDRIAAAGVDPVICLTTSGIPGRNLAYEARFIPLRFRPELASFDAGSLNVGDGVFLNPPEFLRDLARRMAQVGTKPELEIFDTGMIGNCLRLRDEGLLEPPLHFQFVLGAPGGAPATSKALVHMVESIPPGSTWSSIGIGRGHLPIMLTTLALGGHVRVGLEDNIYYQRGVLARSNAQLVERVVRLAQEIGRPVATPDEARRILSLPRAEAGPRPNP
ncbi:BKACE family enzyme [Deferrisoma camini]|uniref:3-keto-5-aminohexanoate cleavage protein n=1 Tax=Deferrisoma camini TaxID=1035120 RepID=UPI00046D66F0|nr:3-keto-5-aminohexanoate cleavage protein [Deferrisoma camini]